ncbi:MAG TPA: FHA domain-containing protein [Pseudonocardiaceae bacterium]|nr:FHA domain-containing protein [Pseudonocardiaceae bacterium]
MNVSVPESGSPSLRPGIALEVWWSGRRWLVPPGQSFVVGRDEGVDLQITDAMVSRHHLLLQPAERGWQLIDQSRNGSFVNGQRIDRLTVTQPVTVSLGAPARAPTVHITGYQGAQDPVLPRPPQRGRFAGERSAAQGQLSAVHQLSASTLRIGRAPDNDVVLSDLLVSRYHAELRRQGQSWQLVDLGSPNGTFVNGQRIARAAIGPQDVVGVGHALLHLDGDRLVERVDTGEVSFRAEDLVVRTPDGKQLLDRVGFALEQRSLLAVVGPSGAGKSTLLRALTGFRPADEGRVDYAGRDLYRDYDELRQRIGLVPQDDILHPQLTVRRALTYAARLRFPSDVAATERKRRVLEVIGELGLTEQADQRITTLSGGQRKRTSVALELLTRPSLLFLDEPTSGLDPGLEKSVMQTLRGLADDGRTVVVVTHSVANLDVCDQLLLLAPGGSMAYFGPPAEALQYFGRHDFADLFLLLERECEVDWGERFRRSEQFARYIGEPAARADRSPPARPGGAAASAPPPQQPAPVQFAILCQRYLAVIAADRQYTIFMAVLPLVLSLLTHALPGAAGLSLAAQLRGERGAPNSILLVLVIGGALMGSAASIRELVKEREIYRRERAIGLSRGAYLMSKLAVLCLITGAQAILLGLLGNLGRPPPDAAVVLGSPMVEIVVALIGVTVGSMVLGLVVSAAIDNADRGMPLLVLLAMLQFILSSALLQIGNSPMLGQLSWIIPARWGFALGAVTIGIPNGPNTRSPYPERDVLWQPTAGTWLFDLAALAAVTVLFVVATALLLRRLEPRRR